MYTIGQNVTQYVHNRTKCYVAYTQSDKMLRSMYTIGQNVT